MNPSTDTLGEDRLLDLGEIEAALVAFLPGKWGWAFNAETDRAPVWLARLCARVRHLEARLANLDAAATPGTITARYRALEELARPLGYSGYEAAPVEKWICERIERAEAASQRLTEAITTARKFALSAVGNLAEQNWETCETELGAIIAALSISHLGAGAPPEDAR